MPLSAGAAVGIDIMHASRGLIPLPYRLAEPRLPEFVVAKQFAAGIHLFVRHAKWLTAPRSHARYHADGLWKTIAASPASF